MYAPMIKNDAVITKKMMKPTAILSRLSAQIQVAQHHLNLADQSIPTTKQAKH
jgi:hypothetical protein